MLTGGGLIFPYCEIYPRLAPNTIEEVLVSNPELLLKSS